MRLIDADELMKKVCGNCQRNDCVPDATDTVYGCMLAESIDQMPTIEPEVRHAHWTNDTFCSNCNRFPIYQGAPISNQELSKYFSYCPYCGARMDGDD